MTNARWLFEPAREPWPGTVLALVRVVAGLIFITAGTTKLLGYPPSPMPMPPIALMSQIGIGGLLEIVGGMAIVAGFLTRPVAFILSGEMAVAYFQFHAPQGFYPTYNNGVSAILYCFLFLYLAVAGPGRWSADAVIAQRK